MRPLLADPSSPWWDDRDTPDGGDSRRHPRRRAMTDAVAELTRPARRRPGRLALGRPAHADADATQTFGESGIGPIEWLFNRRRRGHLRRRRDRQRHRLDRAATGYEVDAVPSMRMIVDLSNLDDSRWIQLTGNSGHAFHPNYDDQFELWRTGQNLPMRWDRATIESEPPTPSPSSPDTATR